MDADEYMNYVISKIYYSSMDWPHNNIKYWRPRTPDGRWRWMTYDNDSGFGIWWPVTDNTLNNVSPVKNGNPFFLGRLLLNPSFRDTFIQRFAAHINTTSSRVERTHRHIQAVLNRKCPGKSNAGAAEGVRTDIASMPRCQVAGWSIRAALRRKAARIQRQHSRRVSPKDR